MCDDERHSFHWERLGADVMLGSYRAPLTEYLSQDVSMKMFSLNDSDLQLQLSINMVKYIAPAAELSKLQRSSTNSLQQSSNRKRSPML